MLKNMTFSVFIKIQSFSSTPLFFLSNIDKDYRANLTKAENNLTVCYIQRFLSIICSDLLWILLATLAVAKEIFFFISEKQPSE